VRDYVNGFHETRVKVGLTVRQVNLVDGNQLKVGLNAHTLLAAQPKLNALLHLVKRKVQHVLVGKRKRNEIQCFN
tara:strand:+ start:2467 stop:2691 length:225 start_codon:yes stop_codon:yes gene_type:complete